MPWKTWLIIKLSLISYKMFFNDIMRSFQIKFLLCNFAMKVGGIVSRHPEGHLELMECRLLYCPHGVGWYIALLYWTICLYLLGWKNNIDPWECLATQSWTSVLHVMVSVYMMQSLNSSRETCCHQIIQSQGSPRYFPRGGDPKFWCYDFPQSIIPQVEIWSCWLLGWEE